MNNIREKLIELIASAKVQTLSFLPPRPISEDYTPYFIETIADHLIANGVTITECDRDCRNCWKTKLVNPQWTPVMTNTNQFWDSNYCSNCGAKMDGDGDV